MLPEKIQSGSQQHNQFIIMTLPKFDRTWMRYQWNIPGFISFFLHIGGLIGYGFWVDFNYYPLSRDCIQAPRANSIPAGVDWCTPAASQAVRHGCLSWWCWGTLNKTRQRYKIKGYQQWFNHWKKKTRKQCTADNQEKVQRRQKWPTQAADFGSSDPWKRCSLASAAICVVDALSLVLPQTSVIIYIYT